MIYVVNFPFCNYIGIQRYLQVRSHCYEVLAPDSLLEPADIILLPGVGTFMQGMKFLNNTGLACIIRRHANAGGCIVGICLGMQLLLEGSAESPGIEGLGLVLGTCERIPAALSFPVPHIGWNSLVLPGSLHPSVELLGEASGESVSDFYFVHSYFAKLSSSEFVIASFRHPSGLMAAAIAKSRIIGFQFHPEKSGPAGYSLLDRVMAA